MGGGAARVGRQLTAKEKAQAEKSVVFPKEALKREDPSAALSPGPVTPSGCPPPAVGRSPWWHFRVLRTQGLRPCPSAESLSPNGVCPRMRWGRRGAQVGAVNFCCSSDLLSKNETEPSASGGIGW